MSRTIKKTSVFLAFLMAALMILTLLPLTVRADENRPPELTDTETHLETIEFDEDDLDDAMSTPGEETEKHIKYTAAAGIGGYSSFLFSGSYAFVLTDDIVLDADTLLVFGANEGESQMLDLNGNGITCDPLDAPFNPETGSCDPAAGIAKEVPVIWSLNIGDGTFTITDSVGDGFILADDDDDSYALIASGYTIIDNGVFKGKVDIYGDSNIFGGNFQRPVKLIGETVIRGGDFEMLLETCSNAWIYDGNFTGYWADSDKMSGNEAAEVNIEGGTFADSERCAATLDDVAATIIGGTFIGLDNANGVEFYADEKGELIVNGGTFTSDNYKGMSVYSNQPVVIIGGLFTGGTNGLYFATDEETSMLTLCGGTYAGDAGIRIFDDTSAKPEDVFDIVLADNHKFDPALEATRVDEFVQTQELIRILPEKAEDMWITDNTEDQDIAGQVGIIIEKLVAGETVPGVSEDLKEALLAAVANHDWIDVELMPIEVSADSLSDEELALINGAMSGDQKLLTLYNVWIAVAINDDYVGDITQLPEEILLGFELPDGLPAVANGYTRNFTVFRIHGGAIAALPGTLNADKNRVEASSNLFSVYALAYEDVKNVTPSTGDNSGLTVFITIGIISAAAITFVGVRKKVNEDN